MLFRSPKKYSEVVIEPYGYYNALQHKPKEGMSFEGPQDEGLEGFVGGLIFGHGPAHLNGFDTNFTSITQVEAIANLLPYDSTNGSQSEGDLYRRFP